MNREHYGFLHLLDNEQKALELVNTPQTQLSMLAYPQAIPLQFGDSKFAHPSVMRAREHQLFSQNEQFNLVLASEVLQTVSQPPWIETLHWLKGHLYALKTGDIDRIKSRQKRDRIDIESDLSGQRTILSEEDYVGPHRYAATVSMLEQAQVAAEEGINCQVLVHVVAEQLGSPLPREDRSKELFEKSEYRFIDLENEELPIGAVLFFHERPVIKMPASLHLAVYVGRDLVGVPWLLHATSQIDKTKPAAELVPLSYVLTNRLRNFFGAVELFNRSSQ